MSSYVEDEVAFKRYQDLLENGSRKLLNFIYSDGKTPNWLSVEKFRCAREMCSKYIGSLVLWHSFLIGFALTVEPRLSQLSAFGKSRDTAYMLKRITGFAEFIIAIYDSDILDPHSQGSKIMRKVG